jgi:hypothetical protein
MYVKSVLHVLSTDLTYFRIPGDQGGPLFFKLKIFWWSFYVVSWIQICIQMCWKIPEFTN